VRENEWKTDNIGTTLNNQVLNLQIEANSTVQACSNMAESASASVVDIQKTTLTAA